MQVADADALATWGAEQRALARALGLSIEVWMDELDAATQRSTGLTAAVVGAAMAQGLGLSILSRLDPAALGQRARALVDPNPPRVDSPVLAEAIRRADELPAGAGAARLKRSRTRVEPPRPDRVDAAPLPSAGEATPDAPGTRPSDAPPPREDGEG